MKKVAWLHREGRIVFTARMIAPESEIEEDESENAKGPPVTAGLFLFTDPVWQVRGINPQLLFGRRR